MTDLAEHQLGHHPEAARPSTSTGRAPIRVGRPAPEWHPGRGRLSGAIDLGVVITCATVLLVVALPALFGSASRASFALAAVTVLAIAAAAGLVVVASGDGRASSARTTRHESTRPSVALAVLVVTTIGALLVAEQAGVSSFDEEAAHWWSTQPFGLDPTIVRVLAATLVVSAFTLRVAAAGREHDRIRRVLIRQITHDDLTHLPNRVHFIDDVTEVLERTWDTEQRAAVMRINLDRFKNINDTFGHHVANEVLVVVADRLRRAAEPLGATAARVGGDDFALLHAGATSIDEAIRSAEHLRVELEQPISIDGSNVFLTASIGVALAARHRTTAPEELVRRADIAAHHAKQNGRNRVEVFDDSMHDRLTRRMDVEHALHGAIGRNEMRLHHQPIIDIVTGTVSGFEALMRWERHEGTFVSPGDFIPVAEETGLICELGAWAIREALGDLRRWIADGLVPARTTMSVNVSPRQMSDAGFASIVRTAIEESGAPPELLWLEITESMMLDEPDEASTALQELSRMGVRVALDDFGTGFSSLSMLQQFPIHRIKIDRSFVSGLGSSGDPATSDASLVRTIIAMAGAMSLDLVAEGVETISQLEQLRRFGCDKAQGFLISRPVPAAAVRSTMVALGELSSLPVFTSHEAVPPGTATGANPPRNDPAPRDPAPQGTQRPTPAFVGSVPGSGRPITSPSVARFPSF